MARKRNRLDHLVEKAFREEVAKLDAGALAVAEPALLKLLTGTSRQAAEMRRAGKIPVVLHDTYAAAQLKAASEFYLAHGIEPWRAAEMARKALLTLADDFDKGGSHNDVLAAAAFRKAAR
jgi:hypothetical protein